MENTSMPCGGIYPCEHKGQNLQCFHCNKNGADHFLEEWDGFLHGDCIEAFLKTEEGRIVLKHGHAVVRMYFEEINGAHVMKEST